MHVGALLGNTPAMLRSMAAAALGGYVLCGINTTRRGDGLAADIRRSDCQLVLADAEHMPLLDGLDLGGATVSTSTGPTTATRWRRRNRLSRIAKSQASTPSSCSSRRAPAATRRRCGSPMRWRCCAAPAWPNGSSSPPTTSATCRCRCSTPTAWRRAGRWRSPAGATMVPAKFSPSRFLPDIRRYGATYMNYVGKPLALVLAHARDSPTTPTTRCARRSATRPPSATSTSSRGGSAARSSTASAPASSPSS